MRSNIAVVLLVLGALSPARAESNELTERGIHEERFVRIGGIDHWVTIKGDNRDHPAILFVHGGPGNPMSLLSDSVYPGWEKEFILIHYDQRGAGRTYGRNLPVEELTAEILDENELTLELLVSDGAELATYLIDYLGKDTLILTGSSWGSALAVKIYHADPNLFSAYIGLSQMVDFQVNIAASYEIVLTMAKAKNDQESLGILRSLGPPPWVNPRSPGRLRRIVRRYEAETTSPQPDLKWGIGYDTDAGRESYYAGEEFSWVKFVGMKGDGFSNNVDLFNGVLEFDVPFVLIQGTEDLLKTPDVSRRYFDMIEAPRKEYILVDYAGHDPNLVMLEKQLEVFRTLSQKN